MTEHRILNILQQNTRKSYVSMLEIFAEEKNLEFDIIAIQEPWRNSQSNTTCNPVPDRFELLYFNDVATRTAMYVNKSIALASWSVVHYNTDFSMLKLRSSDERIIHIHNIYNPGPGTPQPNKSVRILEEKLLEHPEGEHIALGDFNLHHVAWGGVDVENEDSGSEVLLEVAEAHHMRQLLTPNTITYSEAGANSTIDLVFATPLLADSLITCRTQQTIYSSDHFPIETAFDLRTIVQPEKKIRQFKKTDGEALRENMKQELQALPLYGHNNTAEIDEFVDSLLAAITRSIEKSTPLVRLCKYSKPGFDEECKEAVTTAKHLHKVYQERETEEAWEDYKLARNWKKTLIRKMKRKQYRESREQACESPAAMWRACKASRRSGPPPQACTPAIRRPDGSLEDDALLKLELMRKSFFPPPPAVRLEDTVDYEYPPPLRSYDITELEIMRAINRPRPFKAPGPTGIPNRILQLLSPILLPVLHTLFNACFSIGYCPISFRNSITVVLKKPESDDPSNPRDYAAPKSYRPIALLETLSKVFETIMASRMAWMAEAHNLLPEGHMGGRRCTSTEHAVHSLVERIIAAWNKKKVVSALFLDVSGAFDNVSHVRLLHNLKKRRIDHHIVNWVKSFLHGRSTAIRTNEATTENRSVDTGIPQGSPLSPIIYLFYNADLLDIGSGQRNVSTSGFIDDVMFAATGDHTAENIEILRELHEEATEWAERHGCQFSIAKYQLTHFSKKDNEDIARPLILGAHTVEAEPHSRFLGVRMDSKLNWREQVNQVKMRASKSVVAMAKLAGSTWGGCLLSIRQIYEAVVIPQLTYCSSVWYSPTGTKNHRKWILGALQTIQARALRVVTGAFKATPHSALDIEANVIPIKLRLEKLTYNAMLRIAATPIYDKIIEGRSKRRHRQVPPLEALSTKYERASHTKIRDMEKVTPYVVPPWCRPPKTVISNNSKEAKELHDVTILINEATDMLIYTDGSGINDKIGAAAIATQYGVMLKSFLGSFRCHTVYTGELQGVNLALNFAITKKLEHRTFDEVIIFTDNQAAILSCANPAGQSGQALLKDIVDKINMLRDEGIEIRLQWVPAHEGIQGNELADGAAKQATGLRTVRKRNGRLKEVDTRWTAPKALTPNVRAAAKRMINKKAEDDWLQEWTNTKTGRALHHIIKAPSKAVLKIHNGVEKWVSALLIQMRTQKIGLREFLHGFRVPGFDSPECPCGYGLQTVKHVLMQCQLHSNLRWRMWRKERRREDEAVIIDDFRSLLTKPRFARKAAYFMSETGLIGQFKDLPQRQND